MFSFSWRLYGKHLCLGHINTKMSMDKPVAKAVRKGEPGASKGSTSKWASLDDWEKFKPHIKQLYVEEDRTLKDVMAIMASKYGHHAT